MTRKIASSYRRRLDDPCVHPAATPWPANLLRFHVEFRRPPAVQAYLSRIRLIREDGVDVSGALVDLGDGIWSPDERWLTVLFHPGRVKTGLRAREELGPALVEGYSYRLILPAAGRQPPFETNFSTGPAETRPINLRDLILERQARDEHRELVLRLGRTVDSLSARAHLRLIGRDGSALAGPVEIAGDSVRFPCLPAAVALRLDSRFEDPCGNRIGRSFEAIPGDDHWATGFHDLPIPGLDTSGSAQESPRANTARPA